MNLGDIFSDFFQTPFWQNIFSRGKIIGSALSVLFFIWWVVAIWKLRTLAVKEFVGPNSSAKKTESSKGKKLDAIWLEIRSRLQSEDQDDWRLALIEAETLLDEVLRQKGFLGETFDERALVAKTNDGKDIPQIQKAHTIVRFILQDPNYELTNEDARKSLDWFEESLKELKML